MISLLFKNTEREGEKMKKGGQINFNIHLWFSILEIILPVYYKK